MAEKALIGGDNGDPSHAVAGLQLDSSLPALATVTLRWNHAIRHLPHWDMRRPALCRTSRDRRVETQDSRLEIRSALANIFRLAPSRLASNLPIAPICVQYVHCTVSWKAASRILLCAAKTVARSGRKKLSWRWDGVECTPVLWLPQASGVCLTSTSVHHYTMAMRPHSSVMA